jgi:hypothetical protein
MAIRRIGGEIATNALFTAVNLDDRFSAVAAVGDLVEWGTSSNWVVNSCAAGTNAETLGRIVKKQDSQIATVQWFGWNRIIEFAVSSVAPVLGSSVDVSPVHASTVKGTSNATLAQYNRVVGVGTPTGRVQVAFR